MIWAWISAAWILSLLALGKRKVKVEHLIWLLLPVDMYGIPVGGFTVKPFMIFTVFLLLITLRDNHWVLKLKSQWAMGIGILLLLMVAVNAINNDSPASFSASLLLPMVWLCGVIYVNQCDKSAVEDIPNAMVAAGIGFGLVFVAAYIAFQIEPSLPHLATRIRSNPGILMEFRNMQDGVLVRVMRLRGFSIDPNTTSATFLFASVVAMLRIIKRQAKFREWLALALSVTCIILSNSRTAVICMVTMTVLCVIAGYNMADAQNRNRIKLLLLALGGLVVILCVTGVIPKLISSFLSQYENRSGLYDEYGRMSIWQEVIDVWIEEGAFLGVGFGQMQYYTQTGKSAHNTWLEVLCAGGVVVGGMLLTCFALLVWSAFRYPLENKEANKNEFVWVMALGLLAVVILLVSVDHLVYSYLWYTALVMAAITSGHMQHEENDWNDGRPLRRISGKLSRRIN